MKKSSPPLLSLLAFSNVCICVCVCACSLISIRPAWNQMECVKITHACKLQRDVWHDCRQLLSDTWMFPCTLRSIASLFRIQSFPILPTPRANIDNNNHRQQRSNLSFCLSHSVSDFFPCIWHRKQNKRCHGENCQKNIILWNGCFVNGMQKANEW